MARDIITKGPNFVHPEKPSALGSRNSLNRDQRDEYFESRVIIDEEVDKILNHIHAKLPPEVLEKLDVMGSIKSKLHNYFNQEFQNMLNRYIVTMEDEMSKKVRDLVDKEENRILNKYTPRELTDILDRIGGADKFNTGEIEKSMVNMYGHLHGHIQRGVNELETSINSILREKADIGAFVRGENAYSIVKCSFTDNLVKPKTVTNVKLSINILDSELISPIYHYEVPVSVILRDVVAKHIHEQIDREITALNNSLIDNGKEELTDTEEVFEKFHLLENYVSDEDSSNENSKRYQFVAKKFFDAIDGIKAEIDYDNYDALQIRENVKKVIDKENIRNRGFNSAVNSITSILDTSKMGYQHIENHKNARLCVIREYEEEDEVKLPDERYAIRVVFYDSNQLKALRDAYRTQLEELEVSVEETQKVVDGVYKEYKKANPEHQDLETITRRYLGGVEDAPKKGFFFSPARDEDDAYLEEDKVWDELSFIQASGTIVEEENPSYEIRFERLTKRFKLIEEKVGVIYSFQHPEKRRVIEDRIRFLRVNVEAFDALINPFHIQPGLLLDIDITTIKRKRTTMMNMANVLNEFLFSLSKGFADAAFASSTRRRSTVRSDLEQSFGSLAAE